MLKTLSWLCLLAAVACSSARQPVAAATSSPQLFVVGKPALFLATGVFDETLRLGVISDTDARLVFTRIRELDGHAVVEPAQTFPAELQNLGGPQQVTLGLTFSTTGVYSVQVVTGARTVSFDEAFAVLPATVLGGLGANAFCPAAGQTRLDFGGENLPSVNGNVPVLSLTGPGTASPQPLVLPATYAGCTPIVFSRADVKVCNEIVAELPPGLFAGDVTFHLSFRDPPLADVEYDTPLFIDTPPDLIFENVPYAAGDGTSGVTFHGSFHVSPSGGPRFTLDGKTFSGSSAGCSAAGAPGNLVCTDVTMPLPVDIAPGTHQFSVTTAEGCTSSSSIQVLGPPSVTGASPAVVCGASRSGFVTIDGTGFFNPEVFLDGQRAALALSCPPTAGSFATCNRIAIRSMPACNLGVCPQFTPGSHTLTVKNGTSPPLSASFAAPITVEPGPPFLHQPVPSVLYDGLDRQVFVGLENQTGNLVSAQIAPLGGSAVPVKALAAAPGGALVTIPAGLPAGLYDLIIHDESASCPGEGATLTMRSNFVAFAADFDPDGAFAVAFDPDTLPIQAGDLRAGNGGGNALHFAEQAGGPPFWFVADMSTAGDDLSVLRFDLRRSGTGAPAAGADVQLFAGLSGRLEYTLAPAPADAWTHYDVRLDDPAGWTFRGSDGTVRDATAADLREAIDASVLRIRGSAFDGDTDASLDNVSVEFAH